MVNFFTRALTIWLLFTYVGASLSHASTKADGVEPGEDKNPVIINSPVFPITTPTGTVQAQFVAEIHETTVDQVPAIVSRASSNQVSFSNLGAPAEVGDAVKAQIVAQGLSVKENAPSIPAANPHAKRFSVVGSRVFLTFVRIIPAGVWTIGMLQNAAHEAGRTFSLFPMESIITSPDFQSALNVGLSVSGMSAFLFLTYTNTIAKFTDYRGFTGLLTSQLFREYMARHNALRKALRLPEDLQPVQSTGLNKFGKYWLTEMTFYGAILYTMALNGFALPFDAQVMRWVLEGASFIGIGIASMEPMTLLIFHVAFTSALSTWFQGSWDLGIIRYVNAMTAKYIGNPTEQGYHLRVARLQWTGTSLVQVMTLALGNFGVLSPGVAQVIYLALGTVGVGYFYYQLQKYKNDAPLEVPDFVDGVPPAQGPSCEGVFKKTG